MIVFFRHGKTKWNIEKRFQGSDANSELLDVNMDFIENIQQEFDFIFDEILISPSKRAVDYSKILNLKSKILKIDPSINEISFGNLTGQRLEDLPEDLLNERNKNKWFFKPEYGESYEDLYKRLDKITSYLINLKDTKIALIGHETCNKVLIGKLLGYSKEDILNLKQPNECIYKIDNNILYKNCNIGEKEWEKL